MYVNNFKDVKFLGEGVGDGECGKWMRLFAGGSYLLSM